MADARWSKNEDEMGIFNGKPSQYRSFRRKLLMRVGGMKDKHLKLAGPRILKSLKGEAWEATEHLTVAELRTPTGWVKLLECLEARSGLRNE